jgi:hypothetical protein
MEVDIQEPVLEHSTPPRSKSPPSEEEEQGGNSPRFEEEEDVAMQNEEATTPAPTPSSTRAVDGRKKKNKRTQRPLMVSSTEEENGNDNSRKTKKNKRSKKMIENEEEKDAVDSLSSLSASPSSATSKAIIPNNDSQKRFVFLVKDVDPAVRDIVRSFSTPLESSAASSSSAESGSEGNSTLLTSNVLEATHLVVPDSDEGNDKPLWEMDDWGIFVGLIQGSCSIVKAGLFFAAVENDSKWSTEADEEKFTVISKKQAEELKMKAKENFKNLAIFVSVPLSSKKSEDLNLNVIVFLLEALGAKVMTSMRGANICLQLASPESSDSETSSNKRYPQVKFRNLKWFFECLTTGKLKE